MSIIFGVLNDLISALGSALSAILALLPNSPFTWSFGSLTPFLDWVNYFLPISAIVAELPYYLAAVTTYYLVRVLLRWVKAVGG